MALKEQRVLTRTGTLAEWMSANPVLFNGEIANVKDLKKIKVGDGVSTFSQLEYYYSDENAISEFLDFPVLEDPPDYKEGRLWYDENTKSLSYYSDTEGSSLQIGREMWIRARNTTGSTIQDGSVVYISGVTGQTPEVSLALAGTTPKLCIIGFATGDILNNQFGEITTFGLVNGLNTSGFTQGQPLYLSSTVAGMLSETPPEEGNRTKIAIVLNSHATIGTILVCINDAEDYAIESEVIAALNGKANTVHTHTEADITDLDKYTQSQVDNLLSGKENTFIKNTAFNKDFGTAAGTVTEGNDSRLSDAREWLAETVTEEEAELGESITRRAWSSLRVRQAILGWWNSLNILGKGDSQVATNSDLREMYKLEPKVSVEPTLSLNFSKNVYNIWEP